MSRKKTTLKDVKNHNLELQINVSQPLIRRFKLHNKCVNIEQVSSENVV